MTEKLIGDKLNKKQKKFVKHLAETGNVTKATHLAGYSQQPYGSWLKRQPQIQTALQEALEKQELTDNKVAGEIKKGLKATYVKKDEGKKYPDFHARHKYLDTLIKIKGGYAPEKHEIRQEKLTLIVTPDVINGLKDAKAISDDEAEAIEAEIIEEKDATRESQARET
jgi:phage terminase small subunit